jgi:hypothetical protein
VADAYRLAFSRDPAPDERTAARAFLDEQARRIEARLAQSKLVALPSHAPRDVGASQAAAFVDFCHVLVNASEFVYVN